MQHLAEQRLVRQTAPRLACNSAFCSIAQPRSVLERREILEIVVQRRLSRARIRLW